MKIDQIKIANFRLFKANDFKLHPNFNLIIGVNGSGKSSLLRALSVALGGWAHAYVKAKANRRDILDEDVREIVIENRFDKAKNVEIEVSGTASIIDRNLSPKKGKVYWKRSRDEQSATTYISGKIDYGTGTRYNLNFPQLGSDILSYIESGKTFSLPLFAVYECDRLWLPKHEISSEESALAKYSRFDPFKDCFHTAADHRALAEWTLKHQLASLQQGKETDVLLSLKRAAQQALEGCTGLRFDIAASRVIVEFGDKVPVPFEHLSDGQRTMLGLFCDLARRAVILNPHLGAEASEKTEGVVLVDELDLHLHPKWQRRVIEDLRRTFPKIQFIATTHSPFLIQTTREGELIMLDGEPTTGYSSRGIEEVVRYIMGVDMPETSPRFAEMKDIAKKYFEILEQGKNADEKQKQDLKSKLEAMTAPYADNPAYVAFLEQKRFAAGIK